jgi:hypothetical protein
VGEDCDDFGPVLHEELCHLPSRYRAVIVLCGLEGMSQAQAARELGWPIGTVQSRLARGRERLRSRLVRRGLAPGVVIAALTSAGRGASGAVPPALAASTVRGILSLATTRLSLAIAGVFPASVVTLTRGALRAMFVSKLKIAVLVLLSTGLLVGGAGMLVGQEPGTRSGAEAARPSAKAGPDDTTRGDRPLNVAAPLEPEDVLMRRLVESARRRLEAQTAYYKEGRITIDRYLDASSQLMQAEIQASQTRDARIAAARAHLARLKQVEANERQELETGRGTSADVAETELRRIQAELELRTAENPTGRYELEVLQKRVSAVEHKLDEILSALVELKRRRD